MSVGMTRYDNLWDYPFHKIIIGVCVAITYWFGYDFVENLTNGNEIDFVNLLITIISVSILMGVIKDMVKKSINRRSI